MHLAIGKKCHISEAMATCSEWQPYSTVGSIYASSLASEGVTTFAALVWTIE